MSHSLPDGELDRGVSEFGEALAQMVDAVPGAYGAILTDSRDEAIDSARDPGEISALDLDLAGAQIGQSMLRLTRSSILSGLGTTTSTIHCERGAFIASAIRHEYLLALFLKVQANHARALREFERCRVALELFLD